MDSRDILTIKGLIRRGEARTACTYNNIPLERCHFLDLPFYETGKIQKNPISEAEHTVYVRTPYLLPSTSKKKKVQNG